MCTLDRAEGAQGAAKPGQIMPRFALFGRRFGRANVVGEVFGQCLFGANAFEFFHQLAVLVEQHGRRAGYQRMARGLAGVQHVDVGPVPIGFGDLAKDRARVFTSGAVVIGEVQDDRTPGFQGFAVQRWQCCLR